MSVTDPPESKTRPAAKTVAERVGAFRARKKAGKVLVKLEVAPADADNLSDLGFLEGWSIERPDPRDLAVAIAAALVLRKKLGL
ncbi:hypothetical protein [Bradyrhizobium sp. JYMT SZCCT0428]|uniref:hypothetical protein n=1 Tax=Bradyrhizobium sp. JYMT SZCCT0428 TaxID=2807673 RepID=UPI001BA8989D|nr:hypothetical protein [Bradyrhizobium sp. JYMT SZCCT0428]MBR1154820.1 hypothetical protein [Bradyrhizobium sp. JYMT SZCCT0428]